MFLFHIYVSPFLSPSPSLCLPKIGKNLCQVRIYKAHKGARRRCGCRSAREHGQAWAGARPSLSPSPLSSGAS